MLCHVTYCTPDMLTHRQHTSDDIIVASIYFSRIKDKRAWEYKEAGKAKLNKMQSYFLVVVITTVCFQRVKTTVTLHTNTTMFLFVLFSGITPVLRV